MAGRAYGKARMGADIAGFLQVAPWPPEPDAVFWSALVLVAGGLLGEAVFRLFGLPRIVGYSAVGMLIAFLGRGVVADGLSGTARLVLDLGLGLLLFELGSRVNLRWLRANPALLLTSAAEALLGFGAVFGVLHALGLSFNVSLACATLGVASSAAVVGRVASEFRTAGQVTERMVTLTALNTLVAVLAYKLVIAWLHIDRAGDWVQAIAQPLYTFGGSVLLAVLLTSLVGRVSQRLDLRDENSVLLLLGLILLALTAARMLNASTLLVPLMAGVMLRNTTERPWVWPRHFGTAGGVLVLMLFVIVGAAWSVEAVLVGGLMAVALLVARALGKTVAVVGLGHWSGITLRQGLALSLALTPLSGTALVLLADLYRTHPDFAPRLAPIVLSAIAFMELLGPIAVKWALRLAGELPDGQRVAVKEQG
jgi:Kef-type K+ transport system membrane component KefB